MKKILYSVLLLVFVSFSVVALSYDDNEFQVKSREYSELAKKAFDAGDYVSSIEYSKQAEEYAAKSYEYIQRMLARTEAENEMNRARTRLTWARENNAATTNPQAFALAMEALDAGALAFDNEEYDVATVCAKKVLDALSVISGYEKAFGKEDKAQSTTASSTGNAGSTSSSTTSTTSTTTSTSTTPSENTSTGTTTTEIPSDYEGLPKYYVVRTFRGEKDCLWNIAQNPLVYNDPYKWTVLYEANKSRLPDPNNPNWLEPGIILEIPSLKGEVRSGTYNPGNTSETSSENQANAQYNNTNSSSSSTPSLTVTVNPTSENPVTVEVTSGTEGTVIQTTEPELE